MIELAVTAFATLFVVVDPIGLTPLFIALTQGHSQRQRRFIALRAVLIAICLLALFGLLGETLLTAIGISIPAFKIAGGLLLFMTAIEMLFEKRTPRKEQAAEAEPHDDPSVFPLAVPLIAGPGSMAAMVLLIGQYPGELTSQLVVYGVMAFVLFLVLIMFLMGDVIGSVLGKTGINVLTRLFGLLLAALSVQFVLDGLRIYWL